MIVKITEYNLKQALKAAYLEGWHDGGWRANSKLKEIKPDNYKFCIEEILKEIKGDK